VVRLAQIQDFTKIQFAEFQFAFITQIFKHFFKCRYESTKASPIAQYQQVVAPRCLCRKGSKLMLSSPHPRQLPIATGLEHESQRCYNINFMTLDTKK